jgi:hypothetical protein
MSHLPHSVVAMTACRHIYEIKYKDGTPSPSIVTKKIDADGFRLGEDFVTFLDADHGSGAVATFPAAAVVSVLRLQPPAVPEES